MKKVLVVVGVLGALGGILLFWNSGEELLYSPGTPESAQQNNNLLRFEDVTGDVIYLPVNSHFMGTLIYGDTIDPRTFSAKLNGVDVSGLFHPSNGEKENVDLPLELGANELILSVLEERVAGMQPIGDVDRLTLQVVPRSDASGNLNSARMTTTAPGGIPDEPLDLANLKPAEPGKAVLVDRTARPAPTQ